MTCPEWAACMRPRQGSCFVQTQTVLDVGLEGKPRNFSRLLTKCRPSMLPLLLDGHQGAGTGPGRPLRDSGCACPRCPGVLLGLEP